MTEDITSQEEFDPEIQTEIPVVAEDWAYPKAFTQTFVLADGTEIEGGISKSTFSNKIWIFVKSAGYDYGRLAVLLGNPENTSTIRHNISGSERIEYIGYTRLSTIKAEDDGTYTVGLSKPM